MVPSRMVSLGKHGDEAADLPLSLLLSHGSSLFIGAWCVFLAASGLGSADGLPSDLLTPGLSSIPSA